MNPAVRKLVPYLLLAFGLASVAWAISFSTLPLAEFRFNNGDEVKTIDPAKATGQPEHRILCALFEGLLQSMPDEKSIDARGNATVVQRPGVAEQPTISADGKTYTFMIRPEARWSDGTPMTADDFVWSWRRTLHPETASKYAYQLFYIVNAAKYHSSEIAIGDRVEVELDDRQNPAQTFPRGTIVRGVLKEIEKTPEPTLSVGEQPKDDDSPKEKKKKLAAKKRKLDDWKDRWIYIVDVKSEKDEKIDWSATGKLQAFAKSAAVKKSDQHGDVAKLKHILLDFDSQVGVRAESERKLVVTLNDRTPFFSELVAFYPLFPVNRRCVETHGVPHWTKPENLVCNGAYTLKFRRIRDRLRLQKNPHYWGAANVQLNTIDAFPIKSETTGLNMYLGGQLDWTHPAPINIMPLIRKRSDFHSAPQFTTYFYRINTTKPPFDNVLVRRALNMAIDKKKICEEVTQGGQIPAVSFVPPGMAGYVSAPGAGFNKEEAQRLMKEAGYPNGQGLPKIEILFNSQEAHRSIAEVIQHDWQETLGIQAELRPLEWGVYLESQHRMEYQVARAGWVADYSDPNTYLDMFVTGGDNNETGWGNADYDRLIKQAGAEADSKKRMETFRQAEKILLSELPILPIYSYVSINLVRPYVKGFHANAQDIHPLHQLSIDKDERLRVFAKEGLTP